MEVAQLLRLAAAIDGTPPARPGAFVLEVVVPYEILSDIHAEV
jgi:hypothetical protein